MLNYAAKFQQGLSYSQFLETHGTDDHRKRWALMHSKIALTAAQRELLSGWVHFALVCPKIQLRFFDRDTHPDLAQAISICGAPRVPSVLFCSEDDHQIGFYGDRTLSRYRELGAQLSGAACSTGLPTDQAMINAVVQDWLNEFERVQLILRTSGRLRQKHGD
jgi:hypothetical protein